MHSLFWLLLFTNEILQGGNFAIQVWNWHQWKCDSGAGWISAQIEIWKSKSFCGSCCCHLDQKLFVALRKEKNHFGSVSNKLLKPSFFLSFFLLLLHNKTCFKQVTRLWHRHIRVMVIRAKESNYQLLSGRVTVAQMAAIERSWVRILLVPHEIVIQRIICLISFLWLAITVSLIFQLR